MSFRPRGLSGCLSAILPVLAGVTTACGGSPTDGGPEEKDYPFNLSGWVLSSADGAPISHAEVALIHRKLVGDCGFKGGPNCSSVDHVLEEVNADESGRYAIDGIHRGISCLGVHVRGSAPGYEDRSVPVMALYCDGSPASINIVLAPIED